MFRKKTQWDFFYFGKAYFRINHNLYIFHCSFNVLFIFKSLIACLKIFYDILNYFGKNSNDISFILAKTCFRIHYN